MKVFESLYFFSDNMLAMNEPEDQPDNLLPPWNPYSPPSETTRVPVARTQPKSFWPVVVIVSLPLFLVALYTYGLTLPLALSTSLGGIRTAIIYGVCRKMDRQPPSCYVSLCLSTFWCFLFQIVSAVAFFFICASGVSVAGPTIQGEPTLLPAIVAALIIFFVMYGLSISIGVSSRPRISRQ